MIDAGVDPYQFSPTERIKLYYDTDTYGLDWVIGEDIGVYTIDIARNFHPIEQGDRTKDLDRLIRNLNNDYRTDWRERKLRAIELYMNLAGLDYTYTSLRGHSQGDWAEVIIYAYPEDKVDLQACSEAMNDWFAGDIYTLAYEKLEVYTNSNGNTIEQWEVEDTLGCILPVRGQSFDEMAETYFGHLWDKQELTMA